ncbi:MAG: MBL fold metallo-hydrolase [Oscillospiraceae bacterium]|nr:MBL fold metallo-hydrolase [Oscillospiraceae bacterium]
MQLKILGTQSPYNTAGHNCPGFLITDEDAKLMLDCGSGSHRMLNYPQDLENLNVILTHLHRDHYNDIYNLQYASFVFHNQGRVIKPVQVYMPATPPEIYKDISGEDNAYCEYSEIHKDRTLTVGKINITFLPVTHPMETYAVKISDGKSTIVYTSDTSWLSNQDISAFAKDADILISEASLLVSDGFPEVNSHLTAKQAALIAKQAGVKKLIITHFWPEKAPQQFVDEAKEYFENTFAANEGDIYDL